MGFFSSLSSLFGFLGRKQMNIIVVGLDNSGKTTILNQLKAPETRAAHVVPTVGYSMSTFTNENFLFNAFDMSGQSKYRTVWESYYSKCHAIMFVVDSSDRLRMAVARDELWILLDHKDINTKKVPILVLANKMDEKDAMTSAEITASLGLDVIRGHHWGIFSTCALTGAGLDKAMEWLAKEMKQYMETYPEYC
ncbi:unnamed protein product [Auanema sp. JU1783]|nr:unnamed protein product [Auanema sp. JU1783]